MVRGVLDGGRAPLDGRLRVGTNGVAQPPNGVWQSTGGSPCERGMLLVLTFLLGAGNFALHKAVLESRHPLLGRVPWFVHMLGGRGSLVVEFLMLLAALLLVAEGYPAWAWAYLGYTALNGVAAWLILTRRV